MKRYSKLIIAAIIALIFIGTFVFLWQKSQPKEVVYNEFTPKQDSIQKTTIITGKIEPRNEVNIKPQISGIISELYKEPGDYVNAGDVIAKVKVVPEMGQLSSAEMRVRLSEINLKQSETDFKRIENLHEQKLVSDDEYDKSRIAYNSAGAAKQYFTRSAAYQERNNIFGVDTEGVIGIGGISGRNGAYEGGLRPAFCVKSDTAIETRSDIIEGEEVYVIKP